MKKKKIIAITFLIIGIFFISGCTNIISEEIPRTAIDAPRNHYLPKMEEYKPKVNVQQNGMKQVCITSNIHSLLIIPKTTGISMQPTIIGDAPMIVATNFKVEDLIEGTIIGWLNPSGEESHIHRIWKIGEDEKGWYAITKGDNMNALDSIRIRENMIWGVKVAIL